MSYSPADDKSTSINQISGSSVWSRSVMINDKGMETTSEKAGLGGKRKELSLEIIDSRRLQLWGLTVALLVLMLLAMILIGSELSASLPEWFPVSYLKIGIFVLVLLYGFYVFEKELQLRKLSRYLIDEQFEMDVVNRRLKSVETVLESTKAVNATDNLDRTLETIVNQACNFLNQRDICLYLLRSDGELTPSVGNTDQPLKVLAEKVMELNQSRFGRDPKQPDSTHFAVPVTRRDRTFGALAMSSGVKGLDSFETLMTLSLFAEQVATAISQARLTEQQKMHQQQESHQCTHDRLTGLLNRTTFFEQLDEQIQSYGDDAPRVALIFLKIDDLKKFNNSLGFAIGDAIIQRHADTIKTAVSGNSLVGRFGGDSFMVAYFDISGYDEAMKLAQSLRNALVPAIAISNRKLNVTTSIGVALPETFEIDAASLIRNAHIAAYDARAKGGNQVSRFDSNLLDSADRILDLEADLRRAIENDELDIALQPILDLENLQPMGLEALLHWNHPENGFIPASSFIPFAQETGQLNDIDLRAFQKSCAAIRGLIDKGFDIPIHINISPKLLQSEELIPSIENVIKTANVQPSSFVIEINESDPQLENELTVKNVSSLKQLGFGIALDSFGSGAGALDTLSTLPLDYVKTSRTLIADITDQHSRNTDLFDSVVALGNNLGIKVIAVDTQNDHQLELIKEHGCHYGQGNFIGKPLHLKQFLDTYDPKTGSFQVAD